MGCAGPGTICLRNPTQDTPAPSASRPGVRASRKCYESLVPVRYGELEARFHGVRHGATLSGGETVPPEHDDVASAGGPTAADFDGAFSAPYSPGLRRVWEV